MEGKPKTSDKADAILRRWSRMVSARAPWLPQWQEIAQLMNPRAAGITTSFFTPNTTNETVLFDTTAGDALLTMAGGLMSWTMPASSPWFAFDAPRPLAGQDRVVAWAQACSEEMRYLLANSNFYTEAHEDLVNHCGFGTSALYFNVEDDGDLCFESLPLGTFCIEEDDDGEVETLFREFEFTAEQAVDCYGYENLPPTIRESYDNVEKRGTYYKFIHAVYPRPEHERPDNSIGRMASWGKKFASIHVALAAREVVKESGFDNFPFACGRYLKWLALNGRTPYGYGPGFAALPDVRQANFQAMMLDCVVEKIVRPPMIADASMEGDIGLSSGDITWVESNIGQDRWPRPVEMTGMQGIQAGMERMKFRQDTIRAKFHADLWTMFANLEGIRTATEIRERAAEKIDAITPAFTRLTTEKQIPMLKALFDMLLSAGRLPQPPPEAVVPVSKFMGYVPPPEVQFTGRLAMAIKAQSEIAAERVMAELLPIAAAYPEVMAPIDLVEYGYTRARNAGFPLSCIKDKDQVQQELAAKAQAAAQQQQMAMAEQGAKAVGHVGGIPAIQQAMGA